MIAHVRDTLRELERWDASGPPVLSLYLTTNPASGPGANLEAQFNSATESLRAAATDPVEVEAMDRLLRQAWERVTSPTPPQGVALFLSPGRGYQRLLELAVEVPTYAAWEPQPHLRPLLEALDERQETLLVFIDKQHAALFRMALNEVEELESFEDVVPRKHDQGGWAQGPLQRHHEMHVTWHAKRAADALRRLADEGRAARIIVTGPPEAVNEFEEQLPKALQQRVIITSLGLDGPPTPATMKQAAAQVLQRVERTEEAKRLADLLEHVGDGTAVFGIAKVTAAVSEQRASSLLIADTARWRGAHCAACGFLSPEPVPSNCPLCAQLLQPDEDFLERLMERARAQDADVDIVSGTAAEGLRSHGDIAARLRYALPRDASGPEELGISRSD